jgi:hypothetical protein
VGILALSILFISLPPARAPSPSLSVFHLFINYLFNFLTAARQWRKLLSDIGGDGIDEKFLEVTGLLTG